MDEIMLSSDLPACIALGINRNGEVLSYSHGPSIWTGTESVTPNHIFRIYSMTKLVTSIAALQLVEKNLVTLDEDLSNYLPELRTIPLLTDNGELLSPEKAVTLRHLLSHTSGFGYSLTDEKLAKFDQEDWTFSDLPRRFESGTSFLYGTSTDWVGRLIETISEKTLEIYFRENITDPLGMNRTFFNVPDSLQHLIVSIGNRGDTGTETLEESPNRVPENPATVFSGGGGLFSTPNDYAKLLSCLLNDGKMGSFQLLKRHTIEEMRENQIGDIEIDIAENYFNPRFCCNFNGLMDKNDKWGLAWLIDGDQTPYGRTKGTVMWAGAANSYFFIDFAKGVAITFYSQQFPFNHSSSISLFDRFAEILYTSK